MAWHDDALRGGDADPNVGGADPDTNDLFLDHDPAYVRTEEAE